MSKIRPPRPLESRGWLAEPGIGLRWCGLCGDFHDRRPHDESSRCVVCGKPNGSAALNELADEAEGA